MTSLSTHHQDKATFLERLIFNNRPAVIVICLLVSIFLFWQATLIRPSTSFEKMIPLKHPFIEKMMEHRNDLTNLGNTVRISVEAKDGDIFSKEYMETLRQINDEVFYISGGFLEVQPNMVKVLADTVQRAADLDEASAQEAVKAAEKALNEKGADFDYGSAAARLAEAAAQLRTVQQIRKKFGG